MLKLQPTPEDFDLQSSLQGPDHLAMIMDGNGRWAEQRGWGRVNGHKEGAKTVRRVVELTRRSGIANLSLFAFSADNWQRPAAEVAALMRLFGRFLQAEENLLRRHDIRLTVIGRRDRLNETLQRQIARVEAATRDASAMHLRIAIDYSARYEATRCSGPDIPDVDLMIRTGGEQRLSDFLLLQMAYAELLFVDVLWPDFAESHFIEALREFNRRERRFGQIKCVPA